jgi:hypothetical protein
MATERLSMRQIREILRQKWALGRAHRAVAESLRIGLGTVCLVLEKAKRAELDWPTVESLTEEALEARLYARPRAAVPESAARPWPDCAYIHRERRKPGVTLELLHLEYLEQHPDGYRYTQYCEIYRRWLKHRGLSMRQVHRAGEKLFVDYSGKKPTIIDPTTGELIEVELFVAVLGASNYTYAEASYHHAQNVLRVRAVRARQGDALWHRVRGSVRKHEPARGRHGAIVSPLRPDAGRDPRGPGFLRPHPLLPARVGDPQDAERVLH